MNGWRLNQWQRLIVTLGALACFARSYYLEFDEGYSAHPGNAFLLGIILAVLALSPPREGGAWFPLLPFFRKHWRKLLIAIGLIAATVVGLQVLEAQRQQRQWEKERAEAKVESERLASQNAKIGAAREKKIQECIKQAPAKGAGWTEYARRQCIYVNTPEKPYDALSNSFREADADWLRITAAKLRLQDAARVAAQKAQEHSSTSIPNDEHEGDDGPPDPLAADGQN